MDSGKTKEQQEKFWNSRAETFPRYEEGEDSYEAGMLKAARSLGVVFKGAEVLAVGCGSGMYTIRLAKEAKRVTAVDISGEMLRILREDAAAQGLTNIDTYHCDWPEFKSDRKFDVVFCSMTPAVQSDEGREKLLRHAEGWVVYMGFADRIDKGMTAKLYEHYGIKPKQFHDALLMREWLESKGLSFSSYSAKGEWVIPRTRDEAVSICCGILKMHNLEPDADVMDMCLRESLDENGRYTERTEYDIEMIVFDMRT